MKLACLLAKLESLDTRRSIAPAVLELAALDRSDFSASLGRVLQIAPSILEVDRASYWSLQTDPRSIICELGWEVSPRRFERGAVLLASDAPSYFAAIERAIVVAVDNATTDPQTRELGDYLRTRGITALMDVPVWANGKLAGILCHEQTIRERTWTTEDADFAVAIAQVVASLLEARARTQAESVQRRESSLSQLSLALSRIHEPSEVGHRIAAALVGSFADWAAVDELTAEGVKRLAMVHVDPRKEAILKELVSRYPPMPDGVHPSTHVAATQTLVFIPDISEADLRAYARNEEHAKILASLGTRSLMAVPLLDRDRAIGVLILGRSDQRFRREDVDFAEGVALRAASALASARLHEGMRAALHVRDDFLQLAAHELNTPLTSLDLACTLIAKLSGPELAEPIDTVRRQVERIHRLASRIEEADRIRRTGGGKLIGPVDFVALTKGAVESHRSAATRVGSTISLDADDSVVGEGDQARLGQLINNLLDNAIKFGAGQSIELGLHAKEDTAVLTVRDHGIGIAPKSGSDIFSAFGRGVSHRSYGGLGLGLFVAQAIVEAHHGTLRAHSAPGSGTTFTVQLPGFRAAAVSGDGEDRQRL